MADGTEYDYAYINSFVGGLNVQDSPLELKDDEVRSIMNMFLTNKGGAKKRKGYTKYDASTVAYGITGIDNVYVYEYSGGSYVVISAYTATTYGVYYFNGTTYTEITGGASLNYGQRVRFLAYRGYLFIYNGSQFQYVDGLVDISVKHNCVFSTGAVPGTSDTYRSCQPQIIEICDDRMFMVEMNSNALLYTENQGWGVGAPVDINLPNNQSEYIPEQTGDRRGITALKHYGNRDELIAFRENDMYALLGVDILDYQLSKLDGVAGCVSQDGVVETGYGSLVFVGNGQVYEFLEGTIVPIGGRIKPRLLSSSMATCCAVWDVNNDIVLIGYTGGTLVWNVAKRVWDENPIRTWTEFNIPFYSLTRFTAHGEGNVILFVLKDDPFVYQWCVGNHDDTADIYWDLLTKQFDMDQFAATKELRSAKVLCDVDTTTPFYLTAYANSGDKVPVTNTKQVSVVLYGSLWDTMVWDTDTWAAEAATNAKHIFGGNLQPNEFSVEIYGTDHYDVTIYKIAIEMTKLATRR